MKLHDRQFTRIFLILVLCLTALTFTGGAFALATYGASGPVLTLSGMAHSGIDLDLNRAATETYAPAADQAPGGPPTITPAGYLPMIMTLGGGSPPPDDGLVDGGVVSGVDGVSIGAVPGTLTATLPVTISQTSVPTLTLPGDVQPHGNYYSLRAERSAFTGGNGTFILGLPIPTGVMTDRLGIALYDAGGGDEPPRWFVVPGLYDPAGELMLVQLPFLAPQGQTAVLVEHPGLSSPPNTVSSVRPEAAAGPTRFEARCLTTELIHEDCLLDKHVVEEELQTFFELMIGIGYPYPLLMRYATHLSLDAPSVTESNTYVVTIVPDVSECANSYGFYRADMEWFNLCFLPTSVLADAQRWIIRHEYYHATQAAFPKTYDDMVSGARERWISEGTASMAERSDQTALQRSMLRSLHHVDRGLKSSEGDDAYRAQDFWIFLGQASTSALEHFLTLFKEGSVTEDVINWIGSEEGFRNWYWRWVKNQVMVEENITFDGELGQPCKLQGQVVETQRSVDPYNDGLGNYQNTLPPLTSHVVEVVIAPELEGLPQLMVWLNLDGYGQNPDPDLRYKVYVEGETCTSIPDGFRILYNITATKKYYVLVSNTNPDDPRAYTIWFD